MTVFWRRLSILALACTILAATMPPASAQASCPNGVTRTTYMVGGNVYATKCIGSSYLDERYGPTSLYANDNWTGVALLSSDNSHALVMQPATAGDNLVLYNTGGQFGPGSELSCDNSQPLSQCIPTWTATWASNTSATGYPCAIMQNDGNFVVYSGGCSATALWASGTNGSGGVQVVMQTDGNLVIYDASNSPKWATGTNGR